VLVVACTLTLIALAIALLVSLAVSRQTLAPFYAATAIAAWYGGLRAGLLTSILSALAAGVIVLTPQWSLSVTVDAAAAMLGFIIVSTVFTALSEQSRRATRAARTGEERLAYLVDASGVFGSSLNYAETLEAMTRLTVPTFADWCTVNLVRADGTIDRIVAEHVDPVGREAIRDIQRHHPIDPDGPHPIAVAIRSGKAALYDDFSASFRQQISRNVDHERLSTTLRTTSALVVPLIAHQQTIGSIALGRINERTPFTEDDVRLADLLARRAALAIDNARLFEQAHASELRYRSLFDGSDDAIIVVGTDGSTVDANPAAVRLTGFSHDELMLLRLRDILVDRDGWIARNMELLRRDGYWRGDVDIRHKDGSIVPVEARGARIVLPEGEVYVAAWRNIADRRELEQLQQEFIVMVTHDLKTPLTSIKGLAQLNRRRGIYSERYLDEIISQSDHLERLINDLLDVARLEAGRLELDVHPVDLVALARSSVAQVQATTNAHSISFDAATPSLLGSWDGDRVKQVVLNLLTNAVKYSPNGGSIRVRVEPLDGHARLSVSDSGIGIPEDALGRLFSRFYRVESTLAGGEGLGLGLYISRSLVEAHGGQIVAESTVGVGSTFTITLPCTVPASPSHR
jgi:PAS domain S-box-containing protein